MIEFLRLLARRWRLIMALVVVCIGVAGAYTALIPPTYQAQTQLFVAIGNANRSPSGLGTAVFFANSRVKSYPELAKSPLVLDPVIKELDLSTTATSLANQVTADVAANTVLMDVTVEDASASRSAAIANAIATNLVTLIEKLDETSDGESPVKVTIVRPATVPGAAHTPNPVINILVGLFAGLGLGLAAAALRETLDTTIKEESDITEATGLPTIGVVPMNPDVTNNPVLNQSTANAVWSESYRKLRTNISYLDPDNPPRSLLVTSSLPSDGKTITAANLAAAIGQSGRRCVLVEADLRRPSVARVLGLTPDVGVTNVVSGDASVHDVIQRAEGFDVITSGPIPPNPSELLGSQAFHRLLTTLTQRYDSVVVDTPPLLAVTDAAVTAVSADAVILVCRAKRTRRHELRKALDGLRAVDANVVGVVMNQVAPNSASYYDYNYGYTAKRGSDPKNKN